MKRLILIIVLVCLSSTSFAEQTQQESYCEMAAILGGQFMLQYQAGTSTEDIYLINTVFVQHPDTLEMTKEVLKRVELYDIHKSNQKQIATAEFFSDYMYEICANAD